MTGDFVLCLFFLDHLYVVRYRYVENRSFSIMRSIPAMSRSVLGKRAFFKEINVTCLYKNSIKTKTKTKYLVLYALVLKLNIHTTSTSPFTCRGVEDGNFSTTSVVTKFIERFRN